MRFVGFHREKQKKSNFYRGKKVIRLYNCEIKRAHNSEKLDIVLKSATDISESCHMIETSALDFDDSGDGGELGMITLSEVDGLDNYKR